MWSILTSCGLTGILFSFLRDIFEGWPIFFIVLLITGSASFILGLLVFVDNKFINLRANKSVSPANNSIVIPGFEFYPSREILSSSHPLSSIFNDNNTTIWALWHAGTSASTQQDAIKKGNITRLILPNPLDAPIRELANLISKEYEDILQDIIATSKEALNKRKTQDNEQVLSVTNRIELHWYSGITPNSIMIGNPDPLTQDSWIQIENLIPTAPNDRSSYRLIYGQTPFKKLFENIVENYKDLFSNKSIVPSIDDIQLASNNNLINRTNSVMAESFILHSNAVLKKLLENNQGSKEYSIQSIFLSINNDPLFKKLIVNKLMEHYVLLIECRLESLFTNINRQYLHISEIIKTGKINYEQTRSICITICDLIIEYRSCVDAFLNMLEDLEIPGANIFWHHPPYSILIYEKLAENYDELMTLIKNLKIYTSEDIARSLPDDQHTSTFRRKLLWG